MRKLQIRIAGMVAAVALTAVSVHAGALFTPLKDEGANTKTLLFDKAYRALAQEPSTASLDLVKANPDAVSRKAETISVNLGLGLNLLALRVNSYMTKSGSLIWYGVFSDPGSKGLQFNPINTVMLVKNGDKITGNIYYEGKWFAIRPLKMDGRHALVSVDIKRMPIDHPPSYKRLPVIPMRSSGSAALEKVNTVITVMVNYTAAAASASGDINGLIDLAVAESNQGYTNSGVSITLQLVHKSQVFYTESGAASSNFDTDLTRYRTTNDHYMDHTHILRNGSGADVAVLLINNASSCGLASSIGSNVSTAFAVAHWGCATGYYSFAHEIGHLQSARHDPANDPTNTPYAYGHGYQYLGSPSWRTIMAYDCPSGCPRLDYWSSPLRRYNSQPMGTAATNDNARVLNNTRATVAAFKSVPACIPDGGVDDTLGVTSCCSGVAVSGSTYCTNPADWGTTWASCNQICGSQLVNGCVPSGKIDDTLSNTSCCSGAAVSGSTWCLNPADWANGWATCVQVCQ